MRRRHATALHPSAPTTTPFGGIVLERWDGHSLPPDGCVVYSDEFGVEWLTFAPQLRADMRTGCSECDDHA